MKRLLISLGIILLLVTPAIWAKGEAEEKQEVVTLEFFQQKREVVDLFDQIIARFEAQNPGIKIEQVHIADAGQVLTSRLATNDVPDILTHWPNSVDYMQAALEGYYLDVTNDPVANGALDDIIKSITLENGKNYAVPISINTQGVFYNVDLFKENNLTIPKTWAEFDALLKKIQNMGKTPLVFGDKDAWTMGQQLRMLLALDMDGYALIDAVKSGKADALNNQDLKDIAAKFLYLRQYGQPDPLGTSYEQAIFEFSQGNSFMFWQGIWAIPSIEKANPALNYSMFALPAAGNRETRVEYGVDLALVIGNKDPETVAAAKKFVAFVASPEIGQLYADTDGSPSALKQVTFNSVVSAPVVAYVQEGKAFRNIRHKYAPGGNGRSNTAIQQYTIDHDMNLFLSEMNAVFGKP